MKPKAKTATVWALRTGYDILPLQFGTTKSEVLDQDGYAVCAAAMRKLGLANLPIGVPTKVRITVEAVE
jgi:hypothetical protein